MSGVAGPVGGGPLLVAGYAHPCLAAAVAAGLRVGAVEGQGERFPDGELRPSVGCVRGRDVYVLASTGPPVHDNLVELMLLLDACRRGGAARCSAVVAYLGYARQDRRSRDGQALGLRVVADALVAAGAERLVVVDPHSVTVEAAFSVPVLTVTAVPTLAVAVRAGVAHPQVVVAPDLGAVKLAEHYAALLGLPVAVVRKSRLTGAAVKAEDLVGAVTGLAPLVVDDMISTGGTVEAAVQLALHGGARPEITVAATHGLFVGPAADRLRALPIRRLLVTDTLPRTELGLPVVTGVSVAGVLADAISRLHRGAPVDDLVSRA